MAVAVEAVDFVHMVVESAEDESEVEEEENPIHDFVVF